MSTSTESTFTETIGIEGRHHVALYFHSLAGKGGGAERQLLTLAKALLRYGYVVHIITWDTSDAKSFYAIHEKVKWHKLGFNTGIIDKFRRLGRLATLLRKNNIRALIGFVMANNKVVILASLLAGVDLVGAERNGPQMYRIKYHIFGRFINFLSLAACKKITIQFDDFRKGYPSFLQSRLVTIHNPIPCIPRQAPPRAKERQHYKMLFVGRFDRIQKQPAMLLDAFAQICREQQIWSLVMVGDGPDRENLEGQIAKLGLNDRVTLIPSRPDLSNVYKNADLFVIPSLWEGSPNALAEAMAHGLPAIGFRVDGVQQLIQHNQTGWLSPEISTEALATTLSIAMKDTHLFESFGKRAKTAVNVYKDPEIFQEWQKLIMSLGFNHGNQ